MLDDQECHTMSLRNLKYQNSRYLPEHFRVCNVQEAKVSSKLIQEDGIGFYHHGYIVLSTVLQHDVLDLRQHGSNRRGYNSIKTDSIECSGYILAYPVKIVSIQLMYFLRCYGRSSLASKCILLNVTAW
ncbi:hypothetical protein CEXT_544661 [Caerostris extrusa]|uniref:Uncharacterized protein n=1 Tax=Caerostris extrusa TaxID=172846 RepID=A0AAV4USY9_CAEEX|nr:hypothetical protein CEXT_544661 [Caerostris extrusa]